MKVFEALANNTKERGMGDGVVLSAEDIKSAQQKFRQGGFVADMSEFLPDGYKIERPKMSTNDKYIEAYVTNGRESQSATLRFAYDVTANNPTTGNNPAQNRTAWRMPTTVDDECLKHLDPDGNGKFEFDNSYYNPNVPFCIEDCPSLGIDSEKIIGALNGQKITPEFIDKLINKILDMVDMHTEKTGYSSDLETLTQEGEGNVTTQHPLADISKFAQYLKPATVDRLLKSGRVIYDRYMNEDDNPKQYYKDLIKL